MLVRRWRWFLGVIVGLAIASVATVSYESRVEVDHRVRILEQQRAETEARLKSLQAEYEGHERVCESAKDAGDEQRRKLGCELWKYHHTFDSPGWRNDTIRPRSDRRVPFPIDIPNPAVPDEPLVPELNPKGR